MQNRKTNPARPLPAAAVLLAALALATAACRPDTGFPRLGEVPEPADNPTTEAKVELGRLLFFDYRLSGDAAVSCAFCHDAGRGWGDQRDLSTGYPGTRHWRNSQTTVNSAYLQKLFWAGESPSLEAQAKSAMTGNVAGNGDPSMLEERMAQIPEYVERFREAFGVERPTFNLALKAIAAFERAEMISRDSPFDRYQDGKRGALSDEAKRGLELFKGKAKCDRCHNGALFTDEDYHNLGVPQPETFEKDVLAQVTLRYQHYIRGVPEKLYRTADHDLGLYYTTKRDADKGKFRTAPLRYLRYTAPYMHNGALATLEDVVDFYDRGGGSDPNKSPLLEPLGLSTEEKADLVAFLDSLSGTEIAMEQPQLPPYGVIEADGSFRQAAGTGGGR